MEELLARTIEVAVTLKLIAKKELSQHHCRLHRPRESHRPPHRQQAAGDGSRQTGRGWPRNEGIELKQTYAKEGQLLGYKAGRYAHARQFKRMRKVIKRQRTIVGRLQRESAHAR